jgi:pimeloyl-ACP methyl ester carboxylesterase
MALAGTIGLVAAATLGILAYLGFVASRYFLVVREPDEIHFAPASDGWKIAVLRYRPANGAPARGPPVLLVHGIAANGYNFDLTPERSLARHLSGQGRDVWVVELRGRGLSTRPRLFSRERYDWCFDEYVERDLPAAAAAVKRATGQDGLQVVAFSTGALAAYAWLTAPRCEARVTALCALAGPTSFKRTSRALSARLLRSVRWLRHRWLMRLFAPVMGYVRLSPLSIIHNPENVEGTLQRRAMVNLIANFARNELLQYADWIQNDTFRSIDHRRDYRADLPRLVLPVLFVAGPRDALAPPDAVKATFEAVGASDKRFVLCSRAQGFKVNYGHFDLLVGREAPREVYPLVAGWLAEKAGLEQPGQKDGEAQPVGERHGQEAEKDRTRDGGSGPVAEAEAGAGGAGAQPEPKGKAGGGADPA